MSADEIAKWRDGYAWLARGTFLFSTPQIATDTPHRPPLVALAGASGFPTPVSTLPRPARLPSCLAAEADPGRRVSLPYWLFHQQCRERGPAQPDPAKGEP